VKPPDLSGLNEAETAPIVREASASGAIYEMHVPPTEKPDDHLREMAVPSAELANIPSPVVTQGWEENPGLSTNGGIRRGILSLHTATMTAEERSFGVAL
jgi:hypothetical protein